MDDERRAPGTRRPRRTRGKEPAATQPQSGIGVTTATEVADIGLDAAVDVATDSSGLGDLVEGLFSGIGDLLS